MSLTHLFHQNDVKTEQRDRPKKASDTPVHVTAGENMGEESEELDQRTFSVVSRQTSTCA